MTALRDAAIRIEAMGRFQTPAPDRLLECEKAASRLHTLATGFGRSEEPWDVFLKRIGAIDG